MHFILILYNIYFVLTIPKPLRNYLLLTFDSFVLHAPYTLPNKHPPLTSSNPTPYLPLKPPNPYANPHLPLNPYPPTHTQFPCFVHSLSCTLQLFLFYSFLNRNNSPVSPRDAQFDEVCHFCGGRRRRASDNQPLN